MQTPGLQNEWLDEEARTPELDGYLRNFFDALTFPNAFDWNTKPLRWRQAMSHLSGFFHSWTAQTRAIEISHLEALIRKRSP